MKVWESQKSPSRGNFPQSKILGRLPRRGIGCLHDVRDPYGAQEWPRSHKIDFSAPPYLGAEPADLSDVHPPSQLEELEQFQRRGPASPAPPDQGPSAPRGDLFEGVGWGDGDRPPPREGGGGQPPSSGPEPSGGANPLVLAFLLMGVGYVLYEEGFRLYQTEFNRGLSKFESQQKESQPPNTKDGRIVLPQKADMADFGMH